MQFMNPENFAGRSQFARDVAALSQSVSPEQLRATNPFECRSLIETLLQVLKPGAAAESTTAQCLEVLTVIVQTADEFAELVLSALTEGMLQWMIDTQLQSPACHLFLQALAGTVRGDHPVGLKLASSIVDLIVQEVAGSEDMLIVLSALLRGSPEARTHVKAHPMVRSFYRILIHLLCAEKVEVIVHSLCILSAMAHHDHGIRDKLFSATNVHQTFQLIVNLVANSASVSSRAALMAIIRFLLTDTSMCQVLEDYHSLEQSLARLLPLISTPATQYTMGAVELLATLASHSSAFQSRVGALLTNFGHPVKETVESLLNMILSSSNQIESSTMAQMLVLLCSIEQVGTAIAQAGRLLETVMTAALAMGSPPQGYSYGVPAITAAALVVQGIGTRGSASLRQAIGSAIAATPQAAQKTAQLMARAADLNASPEVEATALDITMLLREAKQDSMVSEGEAAALVATVLTRGSAQAVQKALTLAQKLDTSLVANAVVQMRSLSPALPPLIVPPPLHHHRATSPLAISRSPSPIPLHGGPMGGPIGGMLGGPPMISPLLKLTQSVAPEPAKVDRNVEDEMLPVEIKLAEEALVRQHELEAEMIQFKEKAIELQVELDRIPETHTPRKPPPAAGDDNSAAIEAEMNRLKKIIREREEELNEAYRKLVVISKAYSGSAEQIAQADLLITKLKEQLAKLEVELEEATKSLKKQLADALARCADLEQKFQVQGAALEAAHKGRDTAEDAQRQTHVSLRWHVEENKRLQKELDEARQRIKELEHELAACQQALLMCQQDLEISRRECSDLFSRAQHFEAEMENHRTVLRKTSEFTSMIHALSGDVLGSNETEESRSNRAREQGSRGGGGGHMQPNADYKQGHERGLSQQLHQLASNQPNRHHSPVHERPLHERPGGGLHPSQLMHSHPHGPPHHHHHGGMPQIDPYSH